MLRNGDQGSEVMESLKRVGISMTEVTDRLLDEGIELFAESFDHLLAAIAKKREQILGLRT